MTMLFIPILVFIIFIFISHRINEKSYALISQEKRSEMMDILARSKKIALLVLAAIIIASLLLQKSNLIVPVTGFFIYVAAFVIWFGISLGFSLTVLRNKNYPKEFIRLMLIASAIKFLGFIICIIFVLVVNQGIYVGVDS